MPSPKKPAKREPKSAKEKAADARERRLRTIFNITSEEYEKVLQYQGGGCAITGRRHRKDGEELLLAVDHCHRSGKIRGILESSVNKGLAYFQDDPVLLRAAAAYLEVNPVTAALGEEVFGILGKSSKKAANRRYGPRTPDNPKGTKSPQPRKAVKL